MNSILGTALMGLFTLSGSTGTLANAAPVAVQVPSEPAPAAQYSVTMTGYNAVPEQTDGDPTTTATGAYSNPQVIAARSRDLAADLPYGTVIRVDAATTTPNCGYNAVANQVGYRVIADAMHERMSNRIDILLDQADKVIMEGKQVNPGRALGICSGVVISVVGHIDINDIPQTQAELARMVELQQIKQVAIAKN